MFSTIFFYFKPTTIGCLYTSSNIFLCDVIKEGEIGGVRGTHGKERTSFGGKARSKEKVWQTSA
jgi:hypothetical protein